MRRVAPILLLATLVASPVRAATEADYLALRGDLFALEKDAHRNRYRDAWQRVEKALLRFAKRHGARGRGCDARFLAAQAHAGMAGVSRLGSDRREAADLYRSFARICARSRLADDALFRAAELSGPDDARAALELLLEKHDDGDHVPLARRMLASLPPARQVKARPEPARARHHKVATRTAAAAPRKAALDVRALSHPSSGSLPLSVVAGLKVRRVVIDAGHGGQDPGATGPGGTHEKDVTLDIARKLRTELEGAGLEVVLTRDDDTFPRLSERTRIANESGGDLFVSIHCNAARSRKLRGLETWTLNLNSDRYAARLAARENAGSDRGVGELQMIIADLATKANTDDSVRLARIVQEELVDDLRAAHGSEMRDLGIKQALFHVLVGARMPAILVEAGFISNPAEEKLLASEAYQRHTAVAIRKAIERFIADRERLAKGETAEVKGSGVF